MSKVIFFLLFILVNLHSYSQDNYPYSLKSTRLNIEGKEVNMVYLDIDPASATKTIMLLHGKNFNGYYWKDLVPLLVKAGYRVIVPDQVGWGQSDRINLHYSFHMLATNTRTLLKTLGIEKLTVLGHSMGGMLAIRFALMYPEAVDKLILEDPIGLEDYKTFVPYQSIDSLFKKEKAATYESYKKYQQTYYPSWKPEYEQYVQSQANDLQRPDFDSLALVNAITYQMIYEQPVCYELNNLKMPTLIIIGEMDRTIVGKDKLTETAKASHGNYPVLGKQTQQKIKGSTLKLLKGIGHIPHIQDIDVFWNAMEAWIN